MDGISYWQAVIQLIMICIGLLVLLLAIVWFAGLVVYTLGMTIREEVEYRKYMKYLNSKENL